MRAHAHPLAPRRAAAILAVAALLGAVAVVGSAASGATPAPSRAAAVSAKQLAFHDAMRKLWEDHITWTRLAIVSFAGGLPDLQATEERLLQNQTDIGDAIKPYYGRKAGNALTKLLREHILGAVALLQAAKSGDQAAIKTA